MLETIAKQMADSVKEAVTKAVNDVSEKYDAEISALRKQIEDMPKPEKGDKGESVTIEDVRPVIEEAIAAIEVPKGDKGDSVTLEDVKPLVDEAVKGIKIPVPDISYLEKRIEDAISSIPEPEKGDKGDSPSPDEVAKAMEGHFAKWQLDFERKADLILEKAIDRMPKAKDGVDGKNAVELEDFSIELDNDGRTVKMLLKRGEDIIERCVKINAILDKGVFRDGEAYEKGDGVTFGGCFWISQKDAPEGRPGNTDDWRMAVKRGRDGRESVKVERQIDKVAVNAG